MNNELVIQKSWWKRNWLWVIPIAVILLFLMTILFSTNVGSITADITKAYVDTELYEVPLEKIRSGKRAIKMLGDIEAIDKFAILEGSVKYSNDNKTVKSSIRLKGTKGKGMMDIIAKRIDNKWNYEKINLRIKKPLEQKQTIEIITPTTSKL